MLLRADPGLSVDGWRRSVAWPDATDRRGDAKGCVALLSHRDRQGGTTRPSLVEMKLESRPEDGERGARGTCPARAFRNLGCVEIAGMAKKKMQV